MITNIAFKLVHYEDVLYEFSIRNSADIGILLMKIASILENEYKIKSNTLMYNGKSLLSVDPTTPLNEYFNEKTNTIKINDVYVSRSPDDLRIKAKILKFQTEELKNSDFFRYYTGDLEKELNEIDDKLRETRDTIKNFMNKFKENVNSSLRKNLDREDFEEMNTKCNKVIKDCDQIFGSSGKIESFYEHFNNAEKIFKEIKGKESIFRDKYGKVNNYLDCIKKSIGLIVKNNEEFVEYYDYESFIPYNNKNSNTNLDLEFNFIEIPTLNLVDNKKGEEILNLVSTESPNLTEKDRFKVKDLQEDYLDGKLNEYSCIKETICEMIEDHFKKFTSELTTKRRDLIDQRKLEQYDYSFKEKVNKSVKQLKDLQNKNFNIENEIEIKKKIKEELDRINQLETQLDNDIKRAYIEKDKVELILKKLEKFFCTDLLNKISPNHEINTIDRMLTSRMNLEYQNNKVTHFVNVLNFTNKKIEQYSQNVSFERYDIDASRMDFLMNFNRDYFSKLEIMEYVLRDLNEKIDRFDQNRTSMVVVKDENYTCDKYCLGLDSVNFKERKIDFSKTNENAIDYLIFAIFIKHFSDLEELNLKNRPFFKNYEKISSLLFKNVGLHCTNLKILDVTEVFKSNCGASKILSENLCLMNNLEELIFKQNTLDDTFGEIFFNNLPSSLKKLNLQNCLRTNSPLTYMAFSSNLQRLTNIEILNINQCLLYYMTESTFESLFSNLCRLIKLKCLEIEIYNIAGNALEQFVKCITTSKTFEKLVINKMCNLEEGLPTYMMTSLKKNCPNMCSLILTCFPAPSDDLRSQFEKLWNGEGFSIN